MGPSDAVMLFDTIGETGMEPASQTVCSMGLPAGVTGELDATEAIAGAPADSNTITGSIGRTPEQGHGRNGADHLNPVPSAGAPNYRVVGGRYGPRGHFFTMRMSARGSALRNRTQSGRYISVARGRDITEIDHLFPLNHPARMSRACFFRTASSPQTNIACSPSPSWPWFSFTTFTWGRLRSPERALGGRLGECPHLHPGFSRAIWQSFSRRSGEPRCARPAPSGSRVQIIAWWPRSAQPAARVRPHGTRPRGLPMLPCDSFFPAREAIMTRSAPQREK